MESKNSRNSIAPISCDSSKLSGIHHSDCSCSGTDVTSLDRKYSDEDKEVRSDVTSHWKITCCPPKGWPVKYLTWALLLTAFLGALWSIAPGDFQPNKNLFGLVITVLLCIAAEQLIVKVPTPEKFPPIPPLFASLLMGLMLRNLPSPGNVAESIEPSSSSILRTLALTVILTRAGLEIEPEAMKKVKWAVMRLAFLPCLVETCCIGIFAHLILQFPFIWSFMMGFVIAAVSPAVVVPSLILIQDDGLGVDKGIPSLVMAASGIDDVLAITGFTILLGLAIPSQDHNNFFSMVKQLFTPDSTSILNDSLSTEVLTTAATNNTFSNSTFSMVTHNIAVSESESNIGEEIGIAIVEVVIGIVSGLLFGFLISYFPHQKMKYRSFCRGFLLLSIGVFMVFATSLWGIAGAGTLCALIMSFTASLNWKEEAKPLAAAWEHMWVVFQPILFGLTGALVEVEQIDGNTVGLGLAVLSIALIGRLATSTAVTAGLNFNLKEKIFVSVSWIPKGTVQAALGSAAYENAKNAGRPDNEIFWGQQILVLAVLITLITAPLGSFGIGLAGPRLLSKDVSTGSENQDEDLERDQNLKSCAKPSSTSSSDSGFELAVVELSPEQHPVTYENVNCAYDVTEEEGHAATTL